jgi:cytoskeletal protein CcmA (bactofilin family)
LLQSALSACSAPIAEWRCILRHNPAAQLDHSASAASPRLPIFFPCVAPGAALRARQKASVDAARSRHNFTKWRCWHARLQDAKGARKAHNSEGPYVHAKFRGGAKAARANLDQRQLPQRSTPTAGQRSRTQVGYRQRFEDPRQGLKIISQGTLQVDGEIEGDVGGVEVIIGEQGKVTGTVAAERVIVRGRISGVIRGATVALQASSRVEGDIHHMSLAIEQGAEFDGRCRRPSDPSELNLKHEAPPSPPPLRN